MLDIRLPIGLMFTVLGVLLTGYGWATGSDPELYKSSLGYDINFWWGLVLILFGGTMLGVALVTRSSPPKSKDVGATLPK